MKSLAWVGIVSVALMVAGCSTNAYNSGTNGSPNHDLTDFNGEWQLIDGRSDYGGAWLDERDRYRSDDMNTSGRVRYRAWFLPDAFRIEGDRDMLRIEDDDGGLISQIQLDEDYRYGSSDYGDYEARARWINDDRFEVERVGRNGRRIMQAFTLEDRGRRLVVGTRIERDGGMRTYTRVYDRG